MNEVEDDHVGKPAGMLNTVRVTANTLILALFGSNLITVLTGRLGPAELAERIAPGNIANAVDALHNSQIPGTSSWQRSRSPASAAQ